MSEAITYNLPGYGLVEATLYNYTVEIWKFLRSYHHDKQLRQTDQLGALREVYPGAHHTRYEYVIAQLALVTELCRSKGPQGEVFSLSAKTNESDFGCLSHFGGPPTKGEVIQVLIILANIGHLPSTFSGERALLHWFREGSAARSAFRKGLPKEDRKSFDAVLQSFDIYRFNYYISLFLLNRYRRKKNGSEIVDLCQRILRGYLQRENDDASNKMQPAWRLYRAIRRLTYLTLDSLYTPVPLSVDLSSIFRSIDHHRKQVFTERTSFDDALSGFEHVMRDSIYLSPRALLQMAATSSSTYSKLSKIKVDRKISDIYNIIHHSPDKKGGEIFKSSIQASIEYSGVDKLVGLSFNFGLEPYQDQNESTVRWELNSTIKVGITLAQFGYEWDPSKRYLRVAGGIKPACNSEKEEKVAFGIAKELADLSINIQSTKGISDIQIYNNNKSLARFLCRAIFGWDLRYHFRDVQSEGHLPIVSAYGSTKAANIIKSYRECCESKSLLHSDDLHELVVLEKNLRSLSYRGLLLVYAGSLEIANHERELAEFDGTVFFLGNQADGYNLLITEAKNKAKGSSEAEKDLRKLSCDLALPDDRVVIEWCYGGATLFM